MNPVKLLEALGNKYSADILRATAEPRTAQELSDELNIPIATCYRRLEDLSEQGVMEQTGSRFTEDHRHVKLYRRQIERICFDMDEDISVSFKERPEAKSKLDTIWNESVDNIR